MISKSAKQALSDVLNVKLKEKQSKELYYQMCSYLMSRDAFCYVDIIRFKYSLQKEDFNQELIDYFVMEYVLDKMRKKHSLVLSALTYIVTSKS